MDVTVSLLYDMMFVMMILASLVGNCATMCIIISESYQIKGFPTC